MAVITAIVGGGFALAAGTCQAQLSALPTVVLTPKVWVVVPDKPTQQGATDQEGVSVGSPLGTTYVTNTGVRAQDLCPGCDPSTGGATVTVDGSVQV